MDTVEELNGTYFYAGRSNLTASELFFMVFCENVVGQLGLGLVDFGAVVAIVSGRNTLPTRAKPNGAEKGTSYASKASRKVFKKRSSLSVSNYLPLLVVIHLLQSESGR